MKCPYCDNEINDGSKRCPICLEWITKFDEALSVPQNIPDDEVILNPITQKTGTDEHPLVQKIYSNMLISDCNLLSNRSKNRLEAEGLMTVQDLFDYLDTNDACELSGLGAKSINEIIQLNEDIRGKRIFTLKNANEGNILISEVEAFDEKVGHYLEYVGIHTIKDLFEMVNEGVFDSPKQSYRFGKEILSYCRSIADISYSKPDEDRIERYKTLHKPIWPEMNQNSPLYNVSTDILVSADIITNSANQALKDFEINTIGKLGATSVTTLQRNGLSSLNLSGLVKLGSIIDQETFPQFFHNHIIPSIEEKNWDIFLRRSAGESLDSIGNTLGRTRERVRQIANRVENRLIPVLERIIEVQSSSQEPRFISKDTIEEIFVSDNDSIIIEYGLELFKERIEYLEFADLYIIRSYFDDKSVRKAISDIFFNALGEGSFIGEIASKLEEDLATENLEFITIDMILDFGKQNNCYIYGDYISKGKATIQELLDLAAIEFKNGIKLNQNIDRREPDLEKLRDTVKSRFGVDLSETNDRILGSALCRNDDIVAYDRGKVISISNVNIPMAVIDNVHDYIEQQSDTEIYFISIFSAKRGYLTLFGITNHYFLAGLLKCYLPEEYKYTRDSLQKLGADLSTKESRTDKVLRFIHEKGRPITYSEIKALFPGFSDPMILFPILDDHRLIDLGSKSFFAADMIEINDDEKAKICMTINSLLDNAHGVVSIYKVIEKLKGQNNEIIIKYKLNAYGSFSVLSVFLNNEFSFRRPYIFKNKDLKEKKISDIFKEALINKDEIYTDQIDTFFAAVGISGIGEANTREEILGNHIRITKDYYIAKNLFSVSEEAERALSKYMLNHMQNGFVSFVNFSDFSSLPEISFEWNRYVLLSACSLLPELRIISFYTFGGRDNPDYSIIVPATFKGTYIDVVKNFLRSTGKTEWHEDEFIDTLILNGLCRRKIGQQIKDCPDILYLENQKIWILK